MHGTINIIYYDARNHNHKVNYDYNLFSTSFTNHKYKYLSYLFVIFPFINKSFTHSGAIQMTACLDILNTYCRPMYGSPLFEKRCDSANLSNRNGFPERCLYSPPPAIFPQTNELKTQNHYKTFWWNFYITHWRTANSGLPIYFNLCIFTCLCTVVFATAIAVSPFSSTRNAYKMYAAAASCKYIARAPATNWEPHGVTLEGSDAGRNFCSNCVSLQQRNPAGSSNRWWNMTSQPRRPYVISAHTAVRSRATRHWSLAREDEGSVIRIAKRNEESWAS